MSKEMALNHLQTQVAAATAQSAYDKLQAQVDKLEQRQTESASLEPPPPPPTDYATEIQGILHELAEDVNDPKTASLIERLIDAKDAQREARFREETLGPLASSVENLQGPVIQAQMAAVNQHDLQILTQVIEQEQMGIDPQAVFKEMRDMQAAMADKYQISLAEAVSNGAMADQVARSVMERHRRQALEARLAQYEPPPDVSAAPPVPPAPPALGRAPNVPRSAPNLAAAVPGTRPASASRRIRQGDDLIFGP
jgi:hypothetical protein